MKYLLLIQLCLFLLTVPGKCQSGRRVGKFQEVFAWKQITYDINGLMILYDRFAEDDLTSTGRNKRYEDTIYFNDSPAEESRWSQRPSSNYNDIGSTSTVSTTTVDPNDEIGRFFIQYNNVPMGVERVGNRLFVTIPRRRYGIPATLNVINLSRATGRSPSLSPYPDMRRSRSLISVYRTRADECGRLWTVDTGTIEIPNNPRYLQPPAIVVYDLNTDQQILRYQLKSSDLPANNTATGLASITIAIKNGDCSDAYAYIADVVSYGVIVYSLRENNSWRHQHNFFSFNPTSGNLRVAGQSFVWNDGVFSVAIGSEGPDGCRPTYFHPMVSNQEFFVSSCELERMETNQTAYRLVGERGPNSQCTMHGIYGPTNTMFFAEVGRDSVSCWNTGRPLNPDNMAILAQDSDRFSYPSDLHVTGDEVWVMTNTLPRFIYSRLDVNEYNFYIYRAKVQDLIAGTVCESSAQSSQGYTGSQTSRYPQNSYNRRRNVYS